MLETVEQFVQNVLVHNVPNLLIGLVILWVGWKVIKFLSKTLHKLMTRRKVDPSLTGFLVPLIEIALKVLLIITVVNQIGIPVTSFIAILGAAGLAVGMALQGTLQNFAGGVIILVLKPFKVGDYVEQGSYAGTVEAIRIFNTTLKTADNKIVVIPNTQLATNSLTNYSRKEFRRVDLSTGIAYGQSVDKARQVLLALAYAQPEVLTKEEGIDAPAVVVTSLSDSSVDVQLRIWVKSADYWTVFFKMNQLIYEKFTEENIEIPFKQLQIHIDKK
ncbi:MAG: mechanosensitive ion channel [Bacteroidales bacterium]|nr:mechanosensitive ion channel [Bacteroidales bacterium]